MSGALVNKRFKTFGVGNVRFFFRASVSIGKRLSGLAAAAGATALCVSGVFVLLNCADLLLSPT